MARSLHATLSASRVPAKLSVLVLSVAAASSAMALDTDAQRYLPGLGGSDLTAELTSGTTYVQMPIISYHANKLKDGAGRSARSVQPVDLSALGLGVQDVTYKNKVDASANILLPSVTHISDTKFLGANVGVTALLPIVQRKVSLGASDLAISPLVPEPYASLATGGVASGVADASASSFGLGDLQIAPLLHWKLNDGQQSVMFAPTLVLPTGKYSASKNANAGSGDFFTFRPTVQYAYIGDGWDFGARFMLSFNTRNKDNGYHSGNMANMDWQAMKFVSDDIRVGLQGYFVRQLTGDSIDASVNPAVAATKSIINGNKASVNGVGPAVAWVKDGGEMLIEGKVIKEFNARNTTEGQSVWLTISKPL